MGGEAANLGIQVFELALMGSLQLGHRVALLKDIGQALDGRELPLAQHCGSHPVLRRELVERLGLLEQLQNGLGLERGSVRLFHRPILPNPGRRSVQIPGSTIG